MEQQQQQQIVNQQMLNASASISSKLVEKEECDDNNNKSTSTAVTEIEYDFSGETLLGQEEEYEAEEVGKALEKEEKEGTSEAAAKGEMGTAEHENPEEEEVPVKNDQQPPSAIPQELDIFSLMARQQQTLRQKQQDENQRILLALVSVYGQAGNREGFSQLHHSLTMLQGVAANNRPPMKIIDASNPDSHVQRDQLLAISGRGPVYPQFFWVKSNNRNHHSSRSFSSSSFQQKLEKEEVDTSQQNANDADNDDEEDYVTEEKEEENTANPPEETNDDEEETENASLPTEWDSMDQLSLDDVQFFGDYHDLFMANENRTLQTAIRMQQSLVKADEEEAEEDDHDQDLVQYDENEAEDASIATPEDDDDHHEIMDDKVDEETDEPFTEEPTVPLDGNVDREDEEELSHGTDLKEAVATDDGKGSKSQVILEGNRYNSPNVAVTEDYADFAVAEEDEEEEAEAEEEETQEVNYLETTSEIDAREDVIGCSNISDQELLVHDNNVDVEEETREDAENHVLNEHVIEIPPETLLQDSFGKEEEPQEEEIMDEVESTYVEHLSTVQAPATSVHNQVDTKEEHFKINDIVVDQVHDDTDDDDDYEAILAPRDEGISTSTSLPLAKEPDHATTDDALDWEKREQLNSTDVTVQSNDVSVETHLVGASDTTKPIHDGGDSEEEWEEITPQSNAEATSVEEAAKPTLKGRRSGVKKDPDLFGSLEIPEWVDTWYILPSNPVVGMSESLSQRVTEDKEIETTHEVTLLFRNGEQKKQSYSFI